MIEIITKRDQLNAKLFGGKFHVNRPVAQGYSEAILPVSSLFYWSHAIAVDYCEFELHPHRGFEIMTFILEGEVSHYDTFSKVWTSLATGDFQIIQSGSGLKHAEKIQKGTRSFQIWFDPNFAFALKKEPAYTDYRNSDFEPVVGDGLSTIHYIGNQSIATALTEGLRIKKLQFLNTRLLELPVNPDKITLGYVLKNGVTIEDTQLHENDSFRISDEFKVMLSGQAHSEIFIIEVPLKPNYKAVF